MFRVIEWFIIGLIGLGVGFGVSDTYHKEIIRDMQVDAVMLNHAHWDVNGDFDWNPDAELNMLRMED